MSLVIQPRNIPNIANLPAPSGNLDWSSVNVKVADPSNDQHAATQGWTNNQINAKVQGIQPKFPTLASTPSDPSIINTYSNGSSGVGATLTLSGAVTCDTTNSTAVISAHTG